MSTPPKLIGLIDDVHGEDVLLWEAIERLSACGAELLLCVGDVVDGQGDVERCIELLGRYGVLTVRGNHERWMLAGDMRSLRNATRMEQLSASGLAFIRTLPATRTIDTAGGPLLLCHGLGENDMAELKPWDEGYALESNTDLTRVLLTNAAFVVGGHTHRAMNRRFGATTLVNPGTLHREHDPQCALLDATTGELVFFKLATTAA